MKLKAVVPDNFPKDLKDELNAIREEVLKQVIGPYLHRPTFGPADFYVQKCDEVDGKTHGPMCEVRLSGVSVTPDRTPEDFFKARTGIETIYYEKLKKYLPDVRIQLMVSIMLDRPMIPTTLIEGAQSSIYI
jgi:hypothetical protein